MPSEWLKSRRHQVAVTSNSAHSCFCDFFFLRPSAGRFWTVPLHCCSKLWTDSSRNACCGHCSAVSMYLRHWLRLQFVEQHPCDLSRGTCTPQVLNAALVSTGADEKASLAPSTGAATGLQIFAAKSSLGSLLSSPVGPAAHSLIFFCACQTRAPPGYASAMPTVDSLPRWRRDGSRQQEGCHVQRAVRSRKVRDAWRDGHRVRAQRDAPNTPVLNEH